VQPDALFISNERRHIIKDHIHGVPDLTVEVISQGTWQRDRVAKKSLYEQFGMPEYWIVDPESRTIEVFTLVAGSYRVHSRGHDEARVTSCLLEGFAVSFAELESQP
jgi:Uma2 family endonuclease